MNQIQQITAPLNELGSVAMVMERMDLGLVHAHLDEYLSIISFNGHFRILSDKYSKRTNYLSCWFSDIEKEKFLNCIHKENEAVLFESEERMPDGSLIKMEWSIKSSASNSAIFGVRDISWRERYKDQWLLFERIFNSSHSSVAITDSNNRIIKVNKRFEELSGYQYSEVIGFDPGYFSSGRQDKAFYKSLWHSLINDGFWSGIIWNRRKDGREYPEQKTIYTVKNDEGEITNYFSSGTPVLYDDVTSLSASLAPCQSHSILGQEGIIGRINEHLNKQKDAIAVFYIGIDKMNKLNRHGGIALGDHVIRTTLSRLTDTFTPKGLIARSVGDEFIVAAPYISTPDQAASVSQHLLETLRDSVEYQGIEWKFTVSIGIAIAQKTDRPKNIIEAAHIAMHHAKEQGGNCSQFFDHQIQQQANDSILLEHELQNVLYKGELSVHYQPILDAKTGDIISAEALLRWYSPKFGQVPPDRFIPLAEHCGIINDLGLWVVEEVCRQLAKWGEHFAGSVAINLSAHQLQHTELAEHLKETLKSFNIPINRITLEITETAMIHDAQSAISVVKDLKAAGFLLSIDDFGTGYSSLSYLTGFQLDKLKIDRCFINKIMTESQDQLVTKAIINLAKSLGMKVVAEGVEDEEQQQLLCELGCDYLQGYLISKPLSNYDFYQFIASQSLLTNMEMVS